MTNIKRTEAFEQCMLNTVVRTVRSAFDGLTLTNCLESVDFCKVARAAMDMPLFTASYESAAIRARLNLIDRLDNILDYAS